MKENHSVQLLLDAAMSLSAGGIFVHLLLDVKDMTEKFKIPH